MPTCVNYYVAAFARVFVVRPRCFNILQRWIEQLEHIYVMTQVHLRTQDGVKTTLKVIDNAFSYNDGVNYESRCSRMKRVWCAFGGVCPASPL
jgi:hypothetical protein